MIFIGDRPALQCALVTDASLQYVGDKLDPFRVYALVERYVRDHGRAYWGQNHIILSTGLMWAPRYDGMVTKQLRTLVTEAFMAPRVYVIGVSDRVVIGHNLNAMIMARCRPQHPGFSTIREYVRFVGGFRASVEYPAQPTPSEVLSILDTVETLANSV